MTDGELVVRQIVALIVATMGRRIQAGKKQLPPWRDRKPKRLARAA